MEFLVNRPFKNSWRYGIWAWVNENIVSLMESLLSVEKLWKKAQSKRQIIIKIDSEAQHLYKTQSPPSSDNPVFTLIALTKDKQLPGSPQYQPTHSTLNHLQFQFHWRPTWLMFGSVFTWNQKCDLSSGVLCQRWSGAGQRWWPPGRWRCRCPPSWCRWPTGWRSQSPEHYHDVSLTSKNILEVIVKRTEQWTLPFSPLYPKWRQVIEKQKWFFWMIFFMIVGRFVLERKSILQ